MSQSIPRRQSSEPAPLPDSLPTVFTLPGAKRMGWGLSAILHICVIAALLLTKPGEPARRQVGSALSGKGAVDPQTADARLQVAELLRTRQELQRIQARTQTEYHHWHGDQARNAVPAMRKSVLAAAKAQQQAIQAQQKAEGFRQRIEQIAHELEKAKTSPDRLRLLTKMEHATAGVAHTQEQARQAQERAAQAYRKGVARVDFAGEVPAARMQAVRQAFDKASQAQSLAQDAQSNAEKPQSALAEQIRQRKQALFLADKTNSQAQRAPDKAGKAKMQPSAEEARRARETEAKQEADWDSRQKVLTQQLNPQSAAAQHAANQAQEHARQLHSELEQAVRQVSSAPHTLHSVESAEHHGGGTQEEGPPGEPHGAPGPQGGSAVTQNLGMDQLYTEAVNAERANTEAFRQIQAHAAAMAQGIPVERALDATDGAAPVRPPLGKLGQSGAPDGMDAALNRDQREQARQQIDAMAALAHRMLDRVGPHPSRQLSASTQTRSQDAQGVALAPVLLQANVAPSAERIAMATEEEGHAAKDMTRATAGMGTGKTGREAGGKGKWSDAPPASPHPQALPPSAPPIDIQAVPGRVVGSGTMGAGWMFVDSWHTIGPFPNPQRQNIHKAFPPESGVDLDAAYAGKDNRTVRWKWLQAAGPMLVPNDPEEYAIYYGYTELWFDAPADLWIAIGSDDKSTLWIEDQLVWVSSDVLKGWRIDEGLRRVHFKKGVNRVLFRLENGWRGVGLSLCICLKP